MASNLKIEWSIVSGSLPDGVTLDTETGEISGTPTESGSFPVTVKAENACGDITKTITIDVTANNHIIIFSVTDKTTGDPIIGAQINVTKFVEPEIDDCLCDTPLYSGVLSTGLTWKICGDTETLCISGSGNMPTAITGEWRDHYGTFNHIIIGNLVTSIGDNAFQNCINLEEIDIPDSVTNIGENSFSYCIGLIDIIIPDSVISIETSAFSYCTNLVNINIPDSVTSIGGNVFRNCSSLITVIIPDSITSIEDSTFTGCTNLVNITIPNSVISIGDGAFGHCTGLINITIPNSVTTISNSAFYNCTNLAKITNYVLIPQTINIYVFGNVNKTTCILEVPTASLSLYQNADVWKDFQNIIGI